MDDIFKKLGRLPVSTDLTQIDDAVLFALSQHQNERRITSRLLSVAAVVALGIGYAGGSMLPATVLANDTKLVLADAELAPSTLLDFL